MINEEDNLTHIKPECDINSQLAVVLEKLEMSGYSDEVRQEKKDYENPQQKGDSRYIFDPELMESFKKEKKSVNSSIELRPFKMEDVEACYEVYKLFALETSIPLNQGCMDFWRHVTYKAILINIPYSIVAIDTDTSLIVGFIGAEFRENADYLCHFLQIKCLAVHPMFRGMRIAKTLVSALGCVARTLVSEAPYLVYIFKNRTNRLFERILLKIGFTTYRLLEMVRQRKSRAGNLQKKKTNSAASPTELSPGTLKAENAGAGSRTRLPSVEVDHRNAEKNNCGEEFSDDEEVHEPLAYKSPSPMLVEYQDGEERFDNLWGEGEDTSVGLEREPEEVGQESSNGYRKIVIDDSDEELEEVGQESFNGYRKIVIDDSDEELEKVSPQKEPAQMNNSPMALELQDGSTSNEHGMAPVLFHDDKELSEVLANRGDSPMAVEYDNESNWSDELNVEEDLDGDYEINNREDDLDDEVYYDLTETPSKKEGEATKEEKHEKVQKLSARAERLKKRQNSKKVETKRAGTTKRVAIEKNDFLFDEDLLKDALKENQIEVSQYEFSPLLRFAEIEVNLSRYKLAQIKNQLSFATLKNFIPFCITAKSSRGTVVGFVCGRRIHGGGLGSLIRVQLCVVPKAHRKKSIGQQLIQKLANVGINSGAKFLVFGLTKSPNTTTKKFLAKCGFEAIEGSAYSGRPVYFKAIGPEKKELDLKGKKELAQQVHDEPCNGTKPRWKKKKSSEAPELSETSKEPKKVEMPRNRILQYYLACKRLDAEMGLKPEKRRKRAPTKVDGNPGGQEPTKKGSSIIYFDKPSVTKPSEKMETINMSLETHKHLLEGLPGLQTSATSSEGAAASKAKVQITMKPGDSAGGSSSSNEPPSTAAPKTVVRVGNFSWAETEAFFKQKDKRN
ncbi:unnamed protein product [Caenorhabditis auriculariae]|uniref:N-acetyltransferase domain-containing protein n=1 Tax=Caenorhabditis auriculariae TaxID=2777116 RepID=A0A8S1H1I5_9PELO|nr:unnamed protein product [Caenorhabditis auriculariae]